MAEDRIPKRSEIPEEYTWDLRDMYPSDEAWRAEYEALQYQLKNRRQSYRGNFRYNFEQQRFQSCGP